MNNSPQNKIALLVHACDRYEFLYRGFEVFYNKFWTGDIMANLYFATEVKTARVEGFTNIQSGKGEWSDRLIKLLKEEIEEEYVLYMQEDMWFTKPVNAKLLNEVLLYAEKENIDCIKLHSSEVYKTKGEGVFFSGLQLAKLDKQASKFLMSHQVTLWKKSYLLQQLGKNEHPWRNERKASKRMQADSASIYQIDLFAENGKPAINENKDERSRSEYFTVSQNSVLNENVEHFIDVLNNTGEDENYLAQLKKHYEEQITHDGLPKPRKEDWFKKLRKKIGL